VLYNLSASNSIYLPAGVYLGQVGNLAVVRSIDSDVANLINLAAGDGGGNNFITPGVINVNVPDLPNITYGYLKANISPALAANSSRWHVQGYSAAGSFSSEQVVAAITPGQSYVVQFEAVSGYIAPADQTITLTVGVTNLFLGTYQAVQVTNGALTVNLAPPYAVSAGAKWGIGGAYTNASGQSLVLPAGNYLVGAPNLVNFLAPSATNVVVGIGQTNAFTLQYTPVASLSINPSQGLSLLAPSGALYNIQFVSALPATSNQWSNLFTVTLTNTSQRVLYPFVTNAPRQFYRALWLQ
jgi:hypothetical protein